MLDDIDSGAQLLANRRSPQLHSVLKLPDKIARRMLSKSAVQLGARVNIRRA